MTRRATVTVLTLILILTSLSAQPTGYTLTFEDNFDGTQLNMTKWAFCPEMFRQGASYWEADNHRLTGDGKLQLFASESGGTVYCGAIRTKSLFKQTFGYFEVRCKLPKINGGWASFWLFPQNGINSVLNTGTDGTEIDIFEGINGWKNNIQHALHWDGYDEVNHKKESKVMTSQNQLYDDNYHVMAVEWTPDQYIFYIDGKETWRTTAGGVSQVESYLKLTIEVASGTWAGSWSNQQVKPIYWDIDYVRVYKKSTANALLYPSETENISIYPNPSGDYFQIQTPDNLRFNVYVYNNIGQLVIFEKDITKNEKIHHKLTEGLYLLKIINENKRSIDTFKLKVAR